MDEAGLAGRTPSLEGEVVRQIAPAALGRAASSRARRQPGKEALLYLAPMKTDGDQSRAAVPRRIPPWEQAARDAPVLAAADAALGTWLVAPPSSARNMRASQFEQRVLEMLGAVGVGPGRVVREVVLPVGVDLRVRRFLDDPASGSFQRGASLPLRLDLAWLDDDGRTLMVVEVDGAQHGKVDHFLGSVRAVRRDAIKDRLLAAAPPGSLRFLRLGPEFQRNTHAARAELVRRLLGFVRPGFRIFAAPPPPASAAKEAPCPAPLPDPAWCAARRRGRGRVASERSEGGRVASERGEGGRPTSPALARRRRSASSPPDLPRPAAPLGLRRVAEEEALRKRRTLYTRRCRERVRASWVASERGTPSGSRRAFGSPSEGGWGQCDEAFLRRRQAASDSRKRPRDDTFHPYDPRWFAKAYRATAARPST